jgi:hypothetical protein
MADIEVGDLPLGGRNRGDGGRHGAHGSARRGP